MKNNYYIDKATDFISYYFETWECEPNFKSFIDSQVMITDKSFVKFNYGFYKEAWEYLGKDTSEADKVFHDFFIENNIEPYIRTTEDVIAETDKIIEGIKEKQYEKQLEENKNRFGNNNVSKQKERIMLSAYFNNLEITNPELFIYLVDNEYPSGEYAKNSIYEAFKFYEEFSVDEPSLIGIQVEIQFALPNWNIKESIGMTELNSKVGKLWDDFNRQHSL